MRQTYDTIIGIDPDCDRSGVALLETGGPQLALFSFDFPGLMSFLGMQRGRAEANGRMLGEEQRLLVVVEASWMTQANWHGKSGDNRRQASSKGYDVGRNHETGRKIVEMAKDHYGLQVRCKHPLRKCWSGRNGKITHGELMSLLEGSGVTCPRKVTNQEERDAALLALDASGIALRMKGGAR